MTSTPFAPDSTMWNSTNE